jgi:hypothetical protein
MARPLRLQFSGAVYHVTARGNAQQAIFLDEEDRRRFVECLAKEVEQQGLKGQVLSFARLDHLMKNARLAAVSP